ncbi:hypothetical protein AgCh_031388 [Apium graveolens]
MNLTPLPGKPLQSSMASSKIKSVDFYRKIPRDLTEASVSGAGMSILAAFVMIFLFGMELNSYLMMNTTTTVVVDNSLDGDFLRINFNVSFPALSCEFASVDVNDVLGTNRLNITKEIRKYSIDQNLQRTRSGFENGPYLRAIKHDDEIDVEYTEGAISLNARNFEKASHLYDPDMDGRILVGKVDCTEEIELCKRNNIQGYPSIRIFRKGSDGREPESYYGDRDTNSLVTTMEELVAPISAESLTHTGYKFKQPAVFTGGCRLEGFVYVKKVPGNLVISAHSPAHSFDAFQMNMSHVISRFSFGKKITAEGFSDFKRVLPYLGRNHEKLNAKSYIADRGNSSTKNITIEHHLQVVKTEVLTRAHKIIEDYEYTAHSSLVNSPVIPATKFHYELSPMQVAGILDSILHNTIRLIKKVELGKNF